MRPFCALRVFALAVVLVGLTPTARAQELSAETIYQKSIPSVLTLRIENKAGDRYVGSAFLAISEGVAVTAWHVIYDAVKVTAKFADGANCEVLGFIDFDETKDIALIRVDSGKRPLMNISRGKPAVGARTYAIGSPKGYEFSISDGLLSQIQKVDGFHQYQVSCPFSPGNSGGPILNTRGEVVGIAAWTRNGAQNVNFATPAFEAFTLSTSKPLTRWKDFTTRKKAVFAAGDDKKRNGIANESLQSAQDFKKLLQKSGGKQVTVTVQQDGQMEKYTFVVPQDYVK